MYHLSEEQLNEYVDHLMPCEEAKEVERHLLLCSYCQKKTFELQNVFAALKDLPEVSFQVNLAARLQYLQDAPTQKIPKRRLQHVFPRMVPRLAWIIAALEVPLAGLTFAYAWPMLKDWLATLQPFVNLPWQELSLSNWFSVWWNGLNDARIIQSIFTWRGQLQQAVDNLYTHQRVMNWSTPEAFLILTILLGAWAAGNYLLFNLNYKGTK